MIYKFVFFLVLQLSLSHKSESVQIKVQVSYFKHSGCLSLSLTLCYKPIPKSQAENHFKSALLFKQQASGPFSEGEKRERDERSVSKSSNNKASQFQRSLGSPVARICLQDVQNVMPSLTFLHSK